MNLSSPAFPDDIMQEILRFIPERQLIRKMTVLSKHFRSLLPNLIHTVVFGDDVDLFQAFNDLGLCRLENITFAEPEPLVLTESVVDLIMTNGGTLKNLEMTKGCALEIVQELNRRKASAVPTWEFSSLRKLRIAFGRSDFTIESFASTVSNLIESNHLELLQLDLRRSSPELDQYKLVQELSKIKKFHRCIILLPSESSLEYDKMNLERIIGDMTESRQEVVLGGALADAISEASMRNTKWFTMSKCKIYLLEYKAWKCVGLNNRLFTLLGRMLLAGKIVKAISFIISHKSVDVEDLSLAVLLLPRRTDGNTIIRILQALVTQHGRKSLSYSVEFNIDGTNSIYYTWWLILNHFVDIHVWKYLLLDEEMSSMFSFSFETQPFIFRAVWILHREDYGVIEMYFKVLSEAHRNLNTKHGSDYWIGNLNSSFAFGTIWSGSPALGGDMVRMLVAQQAPFHATLDRGRPGWDLLSDYDDYWAIYCNQVATDVDLHRDIAKWAIESRKWPSLFSLFNSSAYTTVSEIRWLFSELMNNGHNFCGDHWPQERAVFKGMFFALAANSKRCFVRSLMNRLSESPSKFHWQLLVDLCCCKSFYGIVFAVEREACKESGRSLVLSLIGRCAAALDSRDDVTSPFAMLLSTRLFQEMWSRFNIIPVTQLLHNMNLPEVNADCVLRTATRLAGLGPFIDSNFLADLSSMPGWMNEYWSGLLGEHPMEWWRSDLCKITRPNRSASLLLEQYLSNYAFDMDAFTFGDGVQLFPTALVDKDDVITVHDLLKNYHGNDDLPLR